MNRKQIIKNRCANYVDGTCVLKGYECPLVTPFEYRGSKFPCEEQKCDYFDTYVLGIDKTAEVNTSTYDTKTCKGCSKKFQPTSSAGKYCSDVCKASARKKAYRRYNSKRTTIQIL